MAEPIVCDIMSSSAQQTWELGKLVGEILQKGLVVRLTGDLGSGKTCFVQGLATGLQVPHDYAVTSPTYALIHDYPGRLPLVHVDLYRIADELDAENIGMWELLNAKTVIAVEWADRINKALWPVDSLLIEFKIMMAETRKIRLFGYGLQIADLIKEVRALWD
jgi:tRNA threonylcarbamoyladenosine biosynthesis protein TsaE